MMNTMKNQIATDATLSPTAASDDTVVIEPMIIDGCEHRMPLVISPGKEQDLMQWVIRNRSEFEQYLTEHGGILFRGWQVDTTEKFHQFMGSFNTEPLPYMFRSSPREEIDKSLKNIYLSTSYPNERSIKMHNESSYSRIWGGKIAFCCVQPASGGGETPLADSRAVLQDIDPELREKFRKKGVRYRRNLSPGLGMPWQEVFQTTDVGAMKQTCERYDISLTWKGEDHAIIEWVKPAIVKHPVSGVETWFNHVYFFNKFSRYEELDMDYDDFLPEEYLSSNTFFGDGTPLTVEEYLNIKAAFDRNKIQFSYEKGDIIFLDNMLVAHGRNPYQGHRMIATAIIEPQYQEGYAI